MEKKAPLYRGLLSFSSLLSGRPMRATRQWRSAQFRPRRRLKSTSLPDPCVTAPNLVVDDDADIVPSPTRARGLPRLHLGRRQYTDFPPRPPHRSLITDLHAPPLRRMGRRPQLKSISPSSPGACLEPPNSINSAPKAGTRQACNSSPAPILNTAQAIATSPAHSAQSRWRGVVDIISILRSRPKPSRRPKNIRHPHRRRNMPHSNSHLRQSQGDAAVIATNCLPSRPS